MVSEVLNLNQITSSRHRFALCLRRACARSLSLFDAIQHMAGLGKARLSGSDEIARPRLPSRSMLQNRIQSAPYKKLHRNDVDDTHRLYSGLYGRDKGALASKNVLGRAKARPVVASDLSWRPPPARRHWRAVFPLPPGCSSSPGWKRFAATAPWCLGELYSQGERHCSITPLD